MILISDISAVSKVKPHPVVLTGTSGRLAEDPEGQHVFVNAAQSHTLEGGPVEGELYKLRFNVAGDHEAIQRMTYIGYASSYGRYVFTKTA